MTTPESTTVESDESLITRIAAGEEGALGALYDRTSTMVYSLALAILKEPADAEEAMSDVFGQVWRSAEGFDTSRGSVQAWIATITRSRALDRLRARRRRVAAADVLASANESDAVSFVSSFAEMPSAGAERGELRAILHESFATLSAPQKQVLELAYFSGLSQSEIAERLGEPLGTVKTRVRAAMEKLRTTLAPMRQRGAL